MAKKRSTRSHKKDVNRSQAIRDFLSKNPKATPKVVIAALAEDGIEVKAGLVSFVKNRMQHSAVRAAGAKWPSTTCWRPRRWQTGWVGSLNCCRRSRCLNGCGDGAGMCASARRA